MSEIGQFTTNAIHDPTFDSLLRELSQMGTDNFFSPEAGFAPLNEAADSALQSAGPRHNEGVGAAAGAGVGVGAALAASSPSLSHDRRLPSNLPSSTSSAAAAAVTTDSTNYSTNNTHPALSAGRAAAAVSAQTRTMPPPSRQAQLSLSATTEAADSIVAASNTSDLPPLPESPAKETAHHKANALEQAAYHGHAHPTNHTEAGSIGSSVGTAQHTTKTSDADFRQQTAAASASTLVSAPPVDRSSENTAPPRRLVMVGGAPGSATATAVNPPTPIAVATAGSDGNAGTLAAGAVNAETGLAAASTPVPAATAASAAAPRATTADEKQATAALLSLETSLDRSVGTSASQSSFSSSMPMSDRERRKKVSTKKGATRRGSFAHIGELAKRRGTPPAGSANENTSSLPNSPLTVKVAGQSSSAAGGGGGGGGSNCGATSLAASASSAMASGASGGGTGSNRQHHRRQHHPPQQERQQHQPQHTGHGSSSNVTLKRIKPIVVRSSSAASSSINSASKRQKTNKQTNSTSTNGNGGTACGVPNDAASAIAPAPLTPRVPADESEARHLRENVDLSQFLNLLKYPSAEARGSGKPSNGGSAAQKQGTRGSSGGSSSSSSSGRGRGGKSRLRHAASVSARARSSKPSTSTHAPRTLIAADQVNVHNFVDTFHKQASAAVGGVTGRRAEASQNASGSRRGGGRGGGGAGGNRNPHKI